MSNFIVSVFKIITSGEGKKIERIKAIKPMSEKKRIANSIYEDTILAQMDDLSSKEEVSNLLMESKECGITGDTGRCTRQCVHFREAWTDKHDCLFPETKMIDIGDGEIIRIRVDGFFVSNHEAECRLWGGDA